MDFCGRIMKSLWLGSSLCGARGGRAAFAWSVPERCVARRAMARATGADGHPRMAATEALIACGGVRRRRGFLSVPEAAMASGTGRRHRGARRPLVAALGAGESRQCIHGVSSIWLEHFTRGGRRQVVFVIGNTQKKESCPLRKHAPRKNNFTGKTETRRKQHETLGKTRKTEKANFFAKGS